MMCCRVRRIIIHLTPLIIRYQTITADQYVKWIYGQSVSLPAKPILITLDDGRIDSPLACRSCIKICAPRKRQADQW